MQTDMRELADVDRGLDDAIQQLHEQKALVAAIDCERTNHDVVLTLLSNVLRQLHRLEGHQNAVLQRLSKSLPLRRQKKLPRLLGPVFS